MSNAAEQLFSASSHAVARGETICVLTNCDEVFDYVEAAIGHQYRIVKVVVDDDSVTHVRSVLPGLVLVDATSSPLRAAALLGSIRRDTVLSNRSVLVVTQRPHRNNEVWVRAGASGCVSTHARPQKLLSVLSELLEDDTSEEEAPGVGEEWQQMSRTLHDEVMQQLFAIGLHLRRAKNADEQTAGLLEATAADLDATITQIRDTIFR